MQVWCTCPGLIYIRVHRREGKERVLQLYELRRLKKQIEMASKSGAARAAHKTTAWVLWGTCHEDQPVQNIRNFAAEMGDASVDWACALRESKSGIRAFFSNPKSNASSGAGAATLVPQSPAFAAPVPPGRGRQRPGKGPVEHAAAAADLRATQACPGPGMRESEMETQDVAGAGPAQLCAGSASVVGTENGGSGCRQPGSVNDQETQDLFGDSQPAGPEAQHGLGGDSQLGSAVQQDAQPQHDWIGQRISPDTTALDTGLALATHPPTTTVAAAASIADPLADPERHNPRRCPPAARASSTAAPDGGSQASPASGQAGTPATLEDEQALMASSNTREPCPMCQTLMSAAKMIKHIEFCMAAEERQHTTRRVRKQRVSLSTGRKKRSAASKAPAQDGGACKTAPQTAGSGGGPLARKAPKPTRPPSPAQLCSAAPARSNKPYRSGGAASPPAFRAGESALPTPGPLVGAGPRSPTNTSAGDDGSRSSGATSAREAPGTPQQQGARGGLGSESQSLLGESQPLDSELPSGLTESGAQDMSHPLDSELQSGRMEPVAQDDASQPLDSEARSESPALNTPPGGSADGHALQEGLRRLPDKSPEESQSLLDESPAESQSLLEASQDESQSLLEASQDESQSLLEESQRGAGSQGGHSRGQGGGAPPASQAQVTGSTPQAPSSPQETCMLFPASEQQQSPHHAGDAQTPHELRSPGTGASHGRAATPPRVAARAPGAEGAVAFTSGIFGYAPTRHLPRNAAEPRKKAFYERRVASSVQPTWDASQDDIRTCKYPSVASFAKQEGAVGPARPRKRFTPVVPGRGQGGEPGQEPPAKRRQSAGRRDSVTPSKPGSWEEEQNGLPPVSKSLLPWMQSEIQEEADAGAVSPASPCVPGEASGGWTCGHCTFINANIHALICELCINARPLPGSSDSRRRSAGRGGIPAPVPVGALARASPPHQSPGAGGRKRKAPAAATSRRAPGPKVKNPAKSRRPKAKASKSQREGKPSSSPRMVTDYFL